MASAPPTSSLTGSVSDAQLQQFLDAVTESIAINSGRGSSQYVAETILSKHDRFGSAPVQINSEMVGLTFFTKPRLNMTTRSLRQDRILAMLDIMDPLSWMFSIRCNLDTVFAKSAPAKDIAANCPFFNDTSPFNIPLGNTIVGMGGWPDYSVEYETTKSGYYSEDMTLVRGSDQGRRTYDLSCTFRDIQGGYVMAYIYYWLRAMTLQMDGTIVAYPDDRDANRLNYTCSIYRFVMDPSMRTIVKWAKATGCYPVSIPLGDVFDFGPGDSFVHTSQQFTIPFKANNVTYMDPIHLSAFNTLVRRYAGDNILDNDNRVLAPPLAQNNFAGIPYVDLTSGTNQLMFLAEPEELVDPTADIITQMSTQLASSVTTGAAGNTKVITPTTTPTT